MTDSARYSRNTALFGASGQECIFRERVFIAGLGGLGSHVEQQLAYLGVHMFVLSDPDIITESSLNRVVGATPDDFAMSVPKVLVAKRVIQQILPDAEVTALVTRLDDPLAIDALSLCSSVFSCLDNDVARLALIELCTRFGKPYFDLATDTDPTTQGSWYGGRVLFSGNGERCPSCMDLLDQASLARAHMSEDELDVDRRMYGIRENDRSRYGPSVVGLNGVVASLAVMEWMAWVTGLRPPAALLEYRGQQGAVFGSSDKPRADCYYCSLWPAANGSAA